MINAMRLGLISGQPNCMRFLRRSIKNALFIKAKKQLFATETLGFSGPANVVFINEDYTQQNNQVVGAASTRKGDVGWKYVWTTGGKVQARRTDDSDILRVATLADIARMVQEGNCID